MVSRVTRIPRPENLGCTKSLALVKHSSGGNAKIPSSHHPKPGRGGPSSFESGHSPLSLRHSFSGGRAKFSGGPGKVLSKLGLCSDFARTLLGLCSSFARTLLGLSENFASHTLIKVPGTLIKVWEAKFARTLLGLCSDFQDTLLPTP